MRRLALFGVLCTVGLVGLNGCGGSTHDLHSGAVSSAEDARAIALMEEEEERVLASGDRARRASEKAVHKAEECLSYGDVICSEAEVARTSVLTEETEEATTNLRRIHREINKLSRSAIKAGMRATMGY